jgi:hypothetical protein
MTIKKFYQELQVLLDDYYLGGDYDWCANKITTLVKEAKEHGLEVNTTSKVLDKITQYSSYDEDESSYDED